MSETPGNTTVLPTTMPARPDPLRGVRAVALRLAVAIEIAVILLVWEVLVGQWRLVNPAFLPPPSAFLGELWSLISSGILARHLGFSAQSFAIGFAISAVVGVGVGLAVGGSRFLNFSVGPIIWTLYSIPRVALAPIIILMLGLGIGSKVAMVFLMAVFPILINTMEGVRTVEPSLRDAGRVYGAGRWRMATQVVLPAILPFVLIGLRLGVIRGYIGVILGEFLGSVAGLGVLLQRAAFDFQMDRALAVALVLVVLANASLFLVSALRRWLAPWYQEETAIT